MGGVSWVVSESPKERTSHVYVQGLRDGSSEEGLFRWGLMRWIGVHVKNVEMGLPDRGNNMKSKITWQMQK